MRVVKLSVAVLTHKDTLLNLGADDFKSAVWWYLFLQVVEQKRVCRPLRTVPHTMQLGCPFITALYKDMLTCQGLPGGKPPGDTCQIRGSLSLRIKA